MQLAVHPHSVCQQQLIRSAGWGLGTASSRAFRIGPKGEPAMLPLIDLCNHSFSPNCRLERQEDGTAVLVSIAPIPEDTPLTISYGRLSNTDLLQDYGFIVEGNPNDALLLSLSANHIQASLLCLRKH